MKSYKLLFLVLLVGFISSCGPKMTASFSPSQKFYEPEEKTVTQTNVAQVPAKTEQVHTQQIVKASNELDNVLEASKEVKPVVIEKNIGTLVKKYAENEQVKKQTLSKEEKQVIRKENKALKKEIKKEIKELRKSSDDDEYIILMILALIIPPLGVGLAYGISPEFWISLILTLIFWLPGAIYSLIKVHQLYR